MELSWNPEDRYSLIHRFQNPAIDGLALATESFLSLLKGIVLIDTVADLRC